MLLIVCGMYACKYDAPLPNADPDNGGLYIPAGFSALVVADSIGKARHLCVRENGDIYVKLSSSNERRKGGNVALRDTTGDGRADIIERFAATSHGSRSYGAGMIIHEGYLYYSSALTVYRQKLTNSLIPTSPMEEVLVDDHNHGVHWHITKPVSFDGKGYMYIPFGGPSNACQDLEASANGSIGGVGLDPCPELELHGGIWKFPAGKTGLRQQDGVKIATGIRSVVAMDWREADEHLYLVMHGRDNLHSLFPNHFTPWQSAVLPSEEFIRVEEGADYGWPYCYFDHMQERKVLAPEYGGDGKIVDRCADKDLPVMGFPGHWAPNDLLFYEGEQFPQRYKGGAFIAFHGSTNRGPYPQSGYFVAFIPFVAGEPSGSWEVFADGFAGVDPIVSTNQAKYRPMGLAEGPDGSLYIAESRQGKIWRIMYQGSREAFGEVHLEEMESHKSMTHIRIPDPVKDDLQKDLPEGERLYLTFCGTCHQKNGEGVAGRFPTLVGTDWVLGEKSRLIDLVLQGVQGPMAVNGELFNGVMPGHAVLPDDQLAIILTFIRQHFGNQASPISAAEVAKERM
ncbi:MAG: cytochrome C [Saprospiraceae bacterium]|nr:cytochrome C [Saprospiraceae bacterium]